MEMKSFLRANLDRVLAVALAVVGILFLIRGWIGVSGTGLAAEQIPFLISGGIGGIALVAIGCTMWVSADLQDEWRRLDSLEDRLVELTGGRAPATVAPAVAVDLTEPEVTEVEVTTKAPARPRRRSTPKTKATEVQA
jgi:hypothetical protein